MKGYREIPCARCGSDWHYTDECVHGAPRSSDALWVAIWGAIIVGTCVVLGAGWVLRQLGLV